MIRILYDAVTGEIRSVYLISPLMGWIRKYTTPFVGLPSCHTMALIQKEV